MTIIYRYLKHQSWLSWLLLLSITAATSNAAAPEESNTKKGERLFSAGQFAEAEKCYKAELTKNQKNITAHYMLGVLFMKTNRTLEASCQFKAAKELDPDGSTGKYSEQYLQVLKSNNKTVSLKSPAKDDTEVKVKENSKENIKPDLKAGAKSRDNSVKDFTIQPISAPKNTVSKAAEKIGQSANSASSDLAAECDREVERAENEANKHIQGLNRQMEKSLDQVDRTTFRNDSYYQDMAIHAEFEGHMQMVKEEAERKVAEIKANYRSKQTAVEDSAFSMHKSYEQRNQVGKIILSPVGSNMHVRNYQTADEPSGDALPVVAAPAKSLPKK